MASTAVDTPGANVDRDEIRRLFDRAQDLEQMADSHGGDDQLYRVADAAWQRAFDAAERDGGAQMLEGLAKAYGFNTPAAREARENDGQIVEDRVVLDPYEEERAAHAEGKGCDFCSVDQPAEWRYPCRDFESTQEFADLQTGESTEVVAELPGDWMACSPCRELIEENRWADVTARFTDAAKERVPEGVDADMWSHIVDMDLSYAGAKVMEGFQQYRKPGPPEPVGERDITEWTWDSLGLERERDGGEREL